MSGLLDQWDVHKHSQTWAALVGRGIVRSLIVRLPKGIRVEQNPCRACGAIAYSEYIAFTTLLDLMADFSDSVMLDQYINIFTQMLLFVSHVPG